MKRRYVNGKLNCVQIIGDRNYYDLETIIKNRLQCAQQFIKRLELESILEGHTGCVNCLEWSSNGRVLASASDDYHVMVWDPFIRKRLIDLTTPHRGNIFSVKFLPKTSDSVVLTGAADGKVFAFDLNLKESPTWKCYCHTLRVKRLATAPETPHIFWSSAEDGNILQFDIREKHTCRSDDKVSLIKLSNHIGSLAEIKCIAINPRRPELLAVGTNDTYARLYDRRMIKLGKVCYKTNDDFDGVRVKDNIPRDCVTYYCPGHLRKYKDKSKYNYSHKAITYLTFSPDGSELLVNMGTEQIYLYDVNNAKDPIFLNLPDYDNKIVQHESKLLVTKRNNIDENVDGLKKMGNDFLENEKYLQAIYQYTSAIRLAPDCPILYLNRATAYMRRNWYGDVYAAIRDCHTALELDPSYIKAHFRLARALLELGYITESNECLEELTKRFPTYTSNNGVLMLRKDINSSIEHETKQQTNLTPSEPEEFSVNELYWRSQAKDYKERFVGHCNTTTDIKEANYFGNDGKYIIAGSDDGNFFIWERPKNIITNIYKGDISIVNCVQPHPYICMLATSGIDHEIRIWSPQPEENFEPEHKVIYFDGTVLSNQHKMQADPFDSAPETICQTS